MRDILPNERSIRNIPIEHRRRAPSTPPRRQGSVEEDYREPPRTRRRINRVYGWWALGVVVLCGALGVLLSTVFAGAVVTVHAKRATVAAPATLRAELQAPVGVLPFEVLSVSASATTTVPASGTSEVRRQASGVVTIYNNYSATSQRLIANTRFEAPDGKIYRIRDSVTVPGMKDGKAGTATATIYADSPGADYNKSGRTMFTIPGFKGDPRYSKFSAQSQGGISGGFIGQEPAVAAADLSKARAELEKKLDADVRAAAAAQIPEGYVSIEGTLQITFSPLLQAAAAGNSASLSQTATARGLMVRHSDLAGAIARATSEGYQGEAVAIEDMNALSIGLATTSKPTDSPITIVLTGTPTLVWQYDPSALKEALLGREKSEFDTIVASFAPAITCSAEKPCNVTVRPFWDGNFSDDPKRIKIITAKD